MGPVDLFPQREDMKIWKQSARQCSVGHLTDQVGKNRGEGRMSSQSGKGKVGKVPWRTGRVQGGMEGFGKLW